MQDWICDSLWISLIQDRIVLDSKATHDLSPSHHVQYCPTLTIQLLKATKLEQSAGTLDMSCPLLEAIQCVEGNSLFQSKQKRGA